LVAVATLYATTAAQVVPLWVRIDVNPDGTVGTVVELSLKAKTTMMSPMLCAGTVQEFVPVAVPTRVIATIVILLKSQ
jgi:hypothetical protein